MIVEYVGNDYLCDICGEISPQFAVEHWDFSVTKVCRRCMENLMHSFKIILQRTVRG